VLLPSATVFLLLLCNDRAVLGPWVNGRATNVFTSEVVAVLVTLSVVLTASVLFSSISAAQIVTIMAGCASLSVAAGGWALIRRRRSAAAAIDRHGRDTWRMPPLNMLSASLLSGGRRAGLAALRVYLAVAMILVIIKIASVAIGH